MICFIAMSNFVNQAFLEKRENSFFFCFFFCFFFGGVGLNKKTIAAFDLKVVDADKSLSLFIIVYLNGDSELTVTYFTERSNFVS